MDEINYQLTILNNHCKFNTFINVWLAGTSPLAPWRLANHCHLGSLVGGWALPLRKRWWSHLGWWHSQYDGKVKKIRGSKPPTKWFIMICCMFFCNSSWFIIISLFHSYPWDGIRSEKNIDEPRGASSFGATFEGEGSLLSCLWEKKSDDPGCRGPSGPAIG